MNFCVGPLLDGTKFKPESINGIFNGTRLMTWKGTESKGLKFYRYFFMDGGTKKCS